MSYWHEGFGYAVEARPAVRRHARKRLRELARALGFVEGSYALRSHRGCATDSVTLRCDKIHVQVRYLAFGGWEMFFRPVNGRRDVNGVDHFEPIYLLDDIEALSLRIRCAMSANNAS